MVNLAPGDRQAAPRTPDREAFGCEANFDPPLVEHQHQWGEEKYAGDEQQSRTPDRESDQDRDRAQQAQRKRGQEHLAPVGSRPA